MGAWIQRVCVLMWIALMAFIPLGARGAPASVIPNSGASSNFFFVVHSNASSMVWVAPPTWKVMRDTIPPVGRGDAIVLHAARNEYEPVQVVVRATAAGTRALNLGSWAGPSAVVPVATLHDVGYGATACVAGNPDRLEPISFGAAQALCPGSNHVFWLTVFVPTNAVAGVYSNVITCSLPGAPTINVPIRVQVFDFALPAETSFGTLVDWNFSGATGDATEIKRWFHEHRLTPRVVTWPSAMQHDITWDSFANPSRCAAFYDEGDQPPLYSIRALAHKFVAGVGFNDGIGFPNFIAQSFSGISQRPANFCGQSIAGDPRGAQYGTAAYNAAWASFLTALQNYCDPTVSPAGGGNPFGHDCLSKAIYYVMNEPLNTSDYNLAAWLAQLSRQAAPKLRLMISEEAKPEIYDNPLYPGQGYDIWVAHLPTYSSAMGNALTRLRDHGEQTWWYSLATDPAHYISPNQANRSALDTRMLAWLAWHHRVEGWGTSGLDAPMMTVSNGTIFVPTIRSELLRETMEDYEYFKLANGGNKAMPFQTNHADRFVSLIASSLTGFDRDPSKLHWLRLQLGRQISGDSASSPLLPLSTPRPFGRYNIDFGYRSNTPPFFFNGQTWIAMGWPLYDPAVTNAGWYVADTNALFVTTAGTGNTVERTLMYEDFERPVTFVFGLANGVYDVTVTMGWPGSVRNDPLFVTVNGVDVFGNRLANVPTTLTTLTSITKRVTVANESLVMEAGRQVNGGYSILNYLTVAPVYPSSPDGLDDTWQTQHFGSPTNVLAGPGEDPDGDRASNWLEFHSGTNPNSSASRPQMGLTFPASNSVELAWSSATNHVFRIDRSGNLSAWSVGAKNVCSTGAVTKATLPRGTNAQQEFFRAVPLAP